MEIAYQKRFAINLANSYSRVGKILVLLKHIFCPTGMGLEVVFDPGMDVYFIFHFSKA